MNGPNATYGFLPWMRRGVSTGITRVDRGGPDGPRATFPATLVFGDTPNREVTAHLALHGPGGVTGIESRMIVRVEPTPGTTNVESNYFPRASSSTSPTSPGATRRRPPPPAIVCAPGWC